MVSELYSGSSGLGSSPGRGHCVVCSWARHLTLTVSLSIQVYKWVLANLMMGVTLGWTNVPSRGEFSSNIPSCYRNQDKLRPDGPLGSYADFTLNKYICMGFFLT